MPLSLEDSIPAAILGLFPFGMRITYQGIISAAGVSLLKLAPRIVGYHFLEIFTVKRPSLVLVTLKELISHGDRLIILSLVGTSEVVMRGKIVLDGEKGDFWFLGSPWITQTRQLESLRLLIDDFGPADAVVDIIHMMANQELVARDTELLIAELNSKKAVLREQAGLLNKTSDLIAQMTQSGTVLFWNSGAERLVGHSLPEAQGCDFCDLLGLERGEWRTILGAAVRDSSWSGDIRVRTKAGEAMVLDATIDGVFEHDGQHCSSLVLVATDVTKRRALDTQMSRNQRLESIGTLAGGIAHDLNNALSPIVVGIDLLRESARPDDKELLNGMMKAVDRCTGMVQHLVAFAKGLDSEKVSVDPAMLMTDLQHLVSTTFPRNINVQFRVPAEVHPILCDSVQIHQVLLNLCINARDAMSNGGSLRVRCDNVDLDEESSLAPEGRPCGLYVVFSVEDTGPGMSQEVRQRVFEPFFTTKEIGKGTGLGLSVSLGIVEEHGGFISLYSEAGRGSRFLVYLPTAAERPLVTSQRPPAARSDGGGQTVLLVDDELPVRQALSTALQHANYRVLEAENGALAVATFAKHEAEIDLVVTDYMMPAMDGLAFISALQSFERKPPVLLLSGIDVSDRIGADLKESIFAVLSKPLTLRDLFETIGSVLGRA